MSPWKPCKRRVFIKKLRGLGFDGPFSGTKHQFMTYSGHRLAIPSNAEYSAPQLRFILKEVELVIHREIPLAEWDEI